MGFVVYTPEGSKAWAARCGACPGSTYDVSVVTVVVLVVVVVVVKRVSLIFNTEWSISLSDI